MSNQKGFYDELKSSIDDKIVDQIEWEKQMMEAE